LSVRELLELASVLYRESIELGIPAISLEDGLILMALAFSISSSRGAVRAVDAGAGIGFSALWIIAGLAPACSGGCDLSSVEIDHERFRRLKNNLEAILGKLGARSVRVNAVNSDALKYLSEVEDESIDYAFIDIEKHEYTEALRILERKLKRGGVAIFHNALKPRPPEEFIAAAASSPWRSLIIPTGAGLMISFKAL